MLNGQDSIVLSKFVASHPFSPAKHLDDRIGYSVALRNADSVHFHELLKSRREALGQFHMAISELYCLRWGPLELPIFTVILNLIYAYPGARKEYLSLTRYLANECKVPVDSVDLAGASALMHSVSTKSFFDEQFAQILLDSKAKINRQDRHGKTAAHYIADVDSTAGSAADIRSSEAMRWYIVHGGNIAIADGAGMSVASRAFNLRKSAPLLMGVILGSKPASPITSSFAQRPLAQRTASYENSRPLSIGQASTTRPTYNRAADSNGSTASHMSTSSAGSMKIGKIQINLPGVTCPCQRRGMWRVCCGVPPDMEAINDALPTKV
jgi:hypothetical protein